MRSNLWRRLLSYYSLRGLTARTRRRRLDALRRARRRPFSVLRNAATKDERDAHANAARRIRAERPYGHATDRRRQVNRGKAGQRRGGRATERSYTGLEHAAARQRTI